MDKRKKEIKGGGLFNSKWMAAIDNAGEVLALHNRESIRLMPKPHTKAEKHQLEGDGTFHLRKNKDLISHVHIFTGFKYCDHSLLQVGDLCPDEILELSINEAKVKVVSPKKAPILKQGSENSTPSKPKEKKTLDFEELQQPEKHDTSFEVRYQGTNMHNTSMNESVPSELKVRLEYKTTNSIQESENNEELDEK